VAVRCRRVNGFSSSTAAIESLFVAEACWRFEAPGFHMYDPPNKALEQHDTVTERAEPRYAPAGVCSPLTFRRNMSSRPKRSKRQRDERRDRKEVALRGATWVPEKRI